MISIKSLIKDSSFGKQKLMKYNFKRLIAQRAASDLSNSHQQRTIKDIHISHVFFRYNTKVTLKIIAIWCIYIKGKEKKPSLIPQETCPNIRHVFFGPRNNLQPQHQVHRSLLFHTKMSNVWSQIWTKILFKKSQLSEKENNKNGSTPPSKQDSTIS